MKDSYEWKITLANNTIKTEGKDKFDLAWEKPGATKKIELIGEKEFGCDLKTGVFNINGEQIKPIGITGNKKLYFRKRRQIRTDGTNILGARTKYIFGYVVNNKEFLASIQPAINMASEEIIKPKGKKIS